MANAPQPSQKPSENTFAKQAEMAQPSLLTELWQFLRHSKKWWLTPVIAILLVVGVLIVLAATGAAPIIYTLF